MRRDPEEPLRGLARSPGFRIGPGSPQALSNQTTAILPMPWFLSDCRFLHHRPLSLRSIDAKWE